MGDIVVREIKSTIYEKTFRCPSTDRRHSIPSLLGADPLRTGSTVAAYIREIRMKWAPDGGEEIMQTFEALAKTTFLRPIIVKIQVRLGQRMTPTIRSQAVELFRPSVDAFLEQGHVIKWLSHSISGFSSRRSYDNVDKLMMSKFMDRLKD